MYSKEHLFDHVMSAVPEGISRDEWLQTLPSALVAGFVKCDIDFQRRGTFFNFILVLISLIYTCLMDAVFLCSKLT